MAVAPDLSRPNFQSVGVLEVRSLSGALVLVDVMCKAGSIEVPGIEVDGNGGSVIKITGGTADVRAAIETGQAMAEKMHLHIGHAIWPRYSLGAGFLIQSKQEYNGVIGANDHLLPGVSTTQS